MTDEATLKKLFKAALLDTSEMDGRPPTRVLPGSTRYTNKQPVSVPISTPTPPVTCAPPVSYPIFTPASPVVGDPSVAVSVPEPVVTMPVTPVVNAGLDEDSSEELRVLLDEQLLRQSRKHCRERLVFFGVTVALVGGGFGWFVKSPQRVEAFKVAIGEIRSTGDVAGMAAKYQAALDKVATRSKQVDGATESMGVSSNQDGEKDPNMNAEMRSLMGDEGATTGERNKLLQQKLAR